MDDEQLEGKVTNKAVEQSSVNTQRHSLPPRPQVSLGHVSAARTPSASKQDTLNRRDSAAHKIPIKIKASATLVSPSDDANKSSSPQITSVKQEEATYAPSFVVEPHEQEPVAPFWGEEDSPDHMQGQSVAIGSTAASWSKKVAEGANEIPLIDRIKLDARLPPVASKQSPEETVGGNMMDGNKWRRVGLAEETATNSKGLVTGSTGSVSAGNMRPTPVKLPPRGPNTSRKHRDDTGSSIIGKGNRRPGPYQAPPPASSFSTPRTPGEPPKAPRAMRLETSNAVTVQQKPANPAAPSNTLSATPITPVNLEDPHDRKPVPADPPKEISDFQIPMGTKYMADKPKMVSRFLQGAELDGTALHIREFPICPVQCTPELSTASGGEPSIIRGRMGCTHSASADLQCLSATLPKEIPIQHFSILQFHADTPSAMTRVASGRSFCCQAVAEQQEGYLRWHIVSGTNVERLSRYFAKKGESLASERLIPKPSDLLEAAKASVTIQQCDQRPGDVVYIPPGSWYQSTAIGGPISLRVWHAYPLKAIVAKDIIMDTATLHRACDHATPPFRNLLYYYLRAFHQTISDPGTTPVLPRNSEKKQVQEITDAIKLFDRLLAGEYTQGAREDEPLLEEPGLCDFCGTDILHAAFVCSSKFGVWERSPVPDHCCEVRLCPACCSEGRSCVCGNLRLCSVLDYDSLVTMRNDIWSWCLSKQENATAAAECLGALTTSDIYEDLRYPHLALGAISILNIRNSVWTDEQHHVDGPHVSCKGGALQCEAHEPSRLQSVTCNECHESVCFKHLLAAGIHSWEAAFRWEHDRSWHEVHSKWSAQWIEWSKTNEPDPEDLLTTLATSHPSCSPLKPGSVRLGFYDVVDPSLNCAKYEDDPILRWFENKSANNDSAIPSIELMVPAIKALKNIKRKSETPGAADLSDTRAVKRKKKNTTQDAAFNPKPKGKGSASKTSKAKSRLGASTPVTPVKEDEFSIDETDESMDLSRSLILASQMLLPDGMDVSGTLNLGDVDAQSSPIDTVRFGEPISLDTKVLANGSSFSGPPSTSRSSYEYSPEQSSSVMTPVELYSVNRDEMALLRQQMESLLRQNEGLNKRIQKLQEDKDAEIQAKEMEIARLTERLLALEAPSSSSQDTGVTSVTPDDLIPNKAVKGNLSPISKYMDTKPPASESESDSDSDIGGNPLVPY